MTSVPHSGAKSVTPGGSVAGGAVFVLSDVESAILSVMPDDGMCYSFGALEAQLDDVTPQFPRAVIEAGVRLLAARGFAEFRRGLFNEDGQTYGSGYRATDAGRHFFWNDAAKATAGETRNAEGAL